MGVYRKENIMIGLFLQELPFDYWDDAYLRHIEGWVDETLYVVQISDYDNQGYVIGRDILSGDSDIGIELTAIDIESIPSKAEVRKEIEDKLKISVTEEEIKIYAFSQWL